jgi:hypothetical protein
LNENIFTYLFESKIFLIFKSLTFLKTNVFILNCSVFYFVLKKILHLQN